VPMKTFLRAAALALLAISPASVFASAGPGLDETVNYLRERCDGMSVVQSGVGTYVYSWSYDAGTIISRESRVNSFDDGGYGPVERRIPIRNVSFGSAEAAMDHEAFIYMACSDSMLEGDCPSEDGSPTRDSIYLACAESRKVLNALAHLQKLLGGAAEATDPFN
jgi:hypothetical protein